MSYYDEESNFFQYIIVGRIFVLGSHKQLVLHGFILKWHEKTLSAVPPRQEKRPTHAL